jgi:HPr kinase/phosphorylase
MRILAKALRDDSEFDLQLELLAGEAGLNREIEHPRVQKPGLAVAGHVAALYALRLQVFGRTELNYLSGLQDAARREKIDGLVTSHIACGVTTCGLDVPSYFIEAAEREQVPLFRTSLQTSLFITRVQDFLAEHLSPEISLHGVLLDVYGIGLMIIGQSGIGKSECALDLIQRGHRLVADDVVIVKHNHGQLFGMGSPLTRHHMEVRGLGIINVKELFGAASVRERKRLELLVELLEWNANLECDRLGIDDLHETILDVGVPKIRLPLRPGRNVASIVEVAARNHLLKVQGHHAARELKERIEQRLSQSSRVYDEEVE